MTSGSTNFLIFHPRGIRENSLFSRSPDSGIILLTRPSHPERSGQWRDSGFRPPSQLRGSGGLSPLFPLLKGSLTNKFEKNAHTIYNVRPKFTTIF